MSFLFTCYLLRCLRHDFSWMISTWNPSPNEWKSKLTMWTDFSFCHKYNYVNVMKTEVEKKTNELLFKLWQTSMHERDIATMPSKKWKAVKSEMTSRLLCFRFYFVRFFFCRNPKLYRKSIFPSAIYIWCSQSIFGCSRSLNFHASYRLNERTNKQTQRVFMNMKRWIHISM